MKNITENLLNYQKITDKIKAKGLPVVAGLELTYDCNLACRHCYVTKTGSEVLNATEYRRLIDDLHDLGTFCLVFTGGEPLLRPDFFEIAGYAKAKGFLTVLFTNGTLIDKVAADRIKENRFWKVEMSLYGAAPGIHDEITQRKGSFEKTLKAVDLLRERGVSLSLKTLLLNLNVHEYRPMKKLAQSLGLDFRADVQINPRLDGDLAPMKYRASREQILGVLNERKDLKSFPCNGLQHVNNLTCNAGKHMMAVSPEGNVKPCVIFPVSCGNIKNTSVKDIWQGRNGTLGKLRAIKWSDLPACEGCDYKSFCVRCHASSYLETGNMLNPSPASCELAKLRYELSLEQKEEIR